MVVASATNVSLPFSKVIALFCITLPFPRWAVPPKIKTAPCCGTLGDGFCADSNTVTVIAKYKRMKRIKLDIFGKISEKTEIILGHNQILLKFGEFLSPSANCHHTLFFNAKSFLFYE
jgi:hypothetical protein